MNQEPLQAKTIDYIFMHMHGRFGNTFLNKFRIGETTDDGKDKGIENAKRVWASRLGGMSKERLKNALDHVYENTPSLDDFVMQCKVQHQPIDYKALPKPIDHDANKANMEKLNTYVAKSIQPKTDYRAWARKILETPKNYPEIAVRFAKEALEIKEEVTV
ncbi:MAG: hypothetical protein RLZZ469_1666 [Bacteroidota bacterium]|jgi:hypothetical protein